MRATDALTSIGTYVREFQTRYEEDAQTFLGPGQYVSFNSCGALWDLLLEAFQVGPGDEVISSPINFFGVHSAILRRGATIVWCDLSADGLTMDPHEVATHTTRRPRLIQVTHMNGLMSNVEGIITAVNTAAAGLGIPPPPIVEDCARAMGASHGLQRQHIRLYSTHRKKITSTLGEGGLLQTSIPALAEKMRRLRSYGLGESFGSSYRLTEPQAAVGSIQLERLNSLVTSRNEILGRRLRTLDGLDLPPQQTLFTEGMAAYLHIIRFPGKTRGFVGSLRQCLSKQGIGSRNLEFTPLSHPFVAAGWVQGSTPIAERLAMESLVLPIHPAMTPQDEHCFVKRIAKCIRTADT